MNNIDVVSTGKSTPFTTPSSWPQRISKAVVVLAIFGLLGFVGVQGRTLVVEWIALSQEMKESRDNLVIGYSDISPNPNYATKPANWFHHEGDQTLLWSGWRAGSHHWFRIGKGELTQEQISAPFGRDSIQAIDLPIVEIGDGVRWRRIPDEASVAGLEVSGKALVYPLKVLEKVEVVNDLIEGLPLVITFAPFAIEREAVAVYEAVLDGRRLNLGVSGYFFGQQPLFYDRETESLWIDTDKGLSAIAGPRKGSILKMISRPVPVAWSAWRSKYPQSRLLVGADRTSQRK